MHCDLMDSYSRAKQHRENRDNNYYPQYYMNKQSQSNDCYCYFVYYIAVGIHFPFQTTVMRARVSVCF